MKLLVKGDCLELSQESDSKAVGEKYEMLEPRYNLGVWGIPDWMYKNQKNWIYSVWCENSYVKDPVPYISIPVWMTTVCASISVDKRLISVCKNKQL